MKILDVTLEVFSDSDGDGMLQDNGIGMLSTLVLKGNTYGMAISHKVSNRFSIVIKTGMTSFKEN